MNSGTVKKLPFLVSIPHGGMDIPPQLQDRIRIGPAEILYDGDAFTREIYDSSNWTEIQLKASIARAFIDLNRAEDDRPPANADGVVKSHTNHLQRIYKDGRQPDQALVERLLEAYYRPYHRKIQGSLSNRASGIRLALDCHSMAAIGPDLSPDPGERRPSICLGNLNGLSCPTGIVDSLADSFRTVFSLDENEVTRDRPFAGGHITRTYGGKLLPWIQIEMSRDLYLRPPWFDPDNLEIDPDRIRELNSMFKEVLLLFQDGL